uniref:BCL domain-containing protein n=1 Tax=Macrostomum lignano TaxID=282301 RepID=A0A1I8HEF3_9PLAT
ASSANPGNAANGSVVSDAAAAAAPDASDEAAAAAAYPPLTPRLLCEPESPPDTEENVSTQADGIFRSFVFERFARDREIGQLDPGTPDSPELARERPPPLSQEARIGRQLAEIGDDIQQRYSSQFKDMIKSLESQLTDSEASFELFRRVAIRLFRDHVINWGRIVALFFFGYRVAVEKIRHGVSGFLRQIVSWICRFLRSVRHITSVAMGGENRLSRNINWRHVTGLSAIIVFCVVIIRYNRQQ